MTNTQYFEQVTYPRQRALSVVDALARALHLGGDFPPPLGSIEYEIVGTTAPAALTFEPPLALWTMRSRSGYVLFDGTYLDVHQRTRRLPLGPGTYRIRVRGDLYQDAEFQLQWPPSKDEVRTPVIDPTLPDSVQLLPGPAYPLPDVTANRLQLGPTILRGSAFTPTGAPVAGIDVEVTNLPILAPGNLPPLGNWPFVKVQTNELGDWAIVLPGRLYIDNTPEILPPNTPPVTKQIAVRIQYPSGVVTKIEVVALGSEHSVKNTGLRGQVTGPGGRPIVGAKITTSVNALTSVTRDDGIWFLYFDLNQAAVPNVAVTATTPDGASATDSTATIVPGATVVVPSFHF